MCNNKECAKYFKSQAAYHRCFEEFRKKWRTYGKPTGRITLKQTSEEERRAVSGIIGKVFYEETIRFTFQEFEQGLQKTRFAPVNMKDVLEEYFGEALITTHERQKEEQERRETFLDRICGYFKENIDREPVELVDTIEPVKSVELVESREPVESVEFVESMEPVESVKSVKSVVLLWIHEMISEKKYGYQILMREYAKDEKQAELLVQNVGNAVMKLKELTNKEEEYPLAVLAAEVTGNPHYFDRSEVAGQLLVHAICHCEKMELPENAYQWRKLLMQVSIVPDNISSMVHGYGLRLLTKQGWHVAYDTFCERKEPYVITMENMKGIIGAKAIGKRAYVVENEMVFSYLIHNLKDSNCTVLCTSGQPRSVAQVLIPYILESGAEVYYNGDIDPDGLGIADRLWKKFGERIHIWRMSPADYEKSLSKEKIGDIGRAKLETISHPILKRTAECMKEKQLVGYQENMLRELLEDMNRERKI